MATLYRVTGWQTHYENAKSRGIEQKSWAVVPAKQDGLGYKRLISWENHAEDGAEIFGTAGAFAAGAAMYGCFLAIILVCTKQRLPRDGWLTDTGAPDGNPLTPEDLELKTGMPQGLIAVTLEVCADCRIGWMEKVTPRILRGYLGDTAVTRKEGRKEGGEVPQKDTGAKPTAKCTDYAGMSMLDLKDKVKAIDEVIARLCSSEESTRRNKADIQRLRKEQVEAKQAMANRK